MAVDLRGSCRLETVSTMPVVKTPRCLNKFGNKYKVALIDAQAKQMRLDRWFELREALRS